jgi:hypothetical protein
LCTNSRRCCSQRSHTMCTLHTINLLKACHTNLHGRSTRAQRFNHQTQLNTLQCQHVLLPCTKKDGRTRTRSSMCAYSQLAADQKGVSSTFLQNVHA